MIVCTIKKRLRMMRLTLILFVLLCSGCACKLISEQPQPVRNVILIIGDGRGGHARQWLQGVNHALQLFARTNRNSQAAGKPRLLILVSQDNALIPEVFKYCT